MRARMLRRRLLPWLAAVAALAGCSAHVRFDPLEPHQVAVGPWTLSGRVRAIDSTQCDYIMVHRHFDPTVGLEDLMRGFPCTDGLRVRWGDPVQESSLRPLAIQIAMSREAAAGGGVEVELRGPVDGLFQAIEIGVRIREDGARLLTGPVDTFLVRAPATIGVLPEYAWPWPPSDAPLDTLSVAGFDAAYGGPGAVSVRAIWRGPLPYAKHGKLTVAGTTGLRNLESGAPGQAVAWSLPFEQSQYRVSRP